MNRLTLVFTGAVFLAALALGQTKRADQRTNEAPENFTDRLGTIIEDFVDKVTREFSSEKTVIPADTIPDEQSKSSQASITFDGDKTVEEGETIRAHVV